MKEFAVKKFYTYIGPNFYLDRRALVFNLDLDPDEILPQKFTDSVLEALPELEGKIPKVGVDLFCAALTRVLKMDIDLYLERIQISRDGDASVIAIEYLDERVTRDGAHLVSEWFQAINEELDFDFQARCIELQEDFDATMFGGPTLYSLIEAGLLRSIPVLYHDDENQFQWGYGSKHVRGRSTTFHVDSIKDTEFTSFKDMCKDFLLVRFEKVVGPLHKLIECPTAAIGTALGLAEQLDPMLQPCGQRVHVHASKSGRGEFQRQR